MRGSHSLGPGTKPEAQASPLFRLNRGSLDRNEPPDPGFKQGETPDSGEVRTPEFISYDDLIALPSRKRSPLQVCELCHRYKICHRKLCTACRLKWEQGRFTLRRDPRDHSPLIHPDSSLSYFDLFPILGPPPRSLRPFLLPLNSHPRPFFRVEKRNRPPSFLYTLDRQGLFFLLSFWGFVCLWIVMRR